MNVNNYKDLDLIKYTAVLSFLIFFNYFLWSINSWEIIKSINFIFLLFVFFYFFISKKYNNYWYLKITIILLLLICLGSPTIGWDARSIYLFSAKRLFYESNLYISLDNYFAVGMNAFPKLPATLSATFAQLIGAWNEVFPKSTNVIIIFPPILFLISSFKNKLFALIWLFLMLLFSGKLLVNGLMDGIIALYFVASVLIVYKIASEKYEKENKIFYLILFLFFSTLSLSKNEGIVIVLVILLSSFLIDAIYKKKINHKLWLTTVVSLVPILFWKYLIIRNNIITEFIQYDPVSRIASRITNVEDVLNIILYIIKNEKLIFSLIIFIFFAYKRFEINKKLIFFILIIFLLYFSILIGSFLLTPKDLLWQLAASSTRIYIPLVLLLSYFSIFLAEKNYSDK